MSDLIKRMADLYHHGDAEDAVETFRNLAQDAFTALMENPSMLMGQREKFIELVRSGISLQSEELCANHVELLKWADSHLENPVSHADLSRVHEWCLKWGTSRCQRDRDMHVIFDQLEEGQSMVAVSRREHCQALVRKNKGVMDFEYLDPNFSKFIRMRVLDHVFDQAKQLITDPIFSEGEWRIQNMTTLAVRNFTVFPEGADDVVQRRVTVDFHRNSDEPRHIWLDGSEIVIPATFYEFDMSLRRPMQPEPEPEDTGPPMEI
jgi:hypothetical protein